MIGWLFVAGLALTGVTAYDGDTLRSGDVSYRLAMVDTPEIGYRAKCWGELGMAHIARARVRRLIAESTQIEATPDDDNPGRRSTDAEGWPLDRHGRRLAHISIDGRDLADLLVSEGLAVRWDPDRPHDWCRVP